MRFMSFAILLTLGLVSACGTGVTPVVPGQKDQPDAFRPLFNGKDLTGWDTWLGRPHRSVEGLDLKKNDKGDYVENVGLNRDPKKVYSVVMMDGQPAIRISGEIWGAITTKEEFENYHFRLEFKWGEKKWPPREQTVRDSGILYHCVGEHGAAGTFWMQSQECQVQENDCGDYWSVAGALIDVRGFHREGNPGSPIYYHPGGAHFTVPRTLSLADNKKRTDNRIIKSADHEKKGEWNTIEVFCLGDTSAHVVNGQIVMVLTNSRRKVGDKEVPLTKGKIQIQSEGAEVYYRNIAVRPITELFGTRRP